MNLGRPATPLPIAEPPRDAPGPLRLPIALRPQPDGTDPERLLAWQRVMAERQAMIDLGYDPSATPRPGGQ